MPLRAASLILLVCVSACSRKSEESTAPTLGVVNDELRDLVQNHCDDYDQKSSNGPDPRTAEFNFGPRATMRQLAYLGCPAATAIYDMETKQLYMYSLSNTDASTIDRIVDVLGRTGLPASIVADVKAEKPDQRSKKEWRDYASEES